ncbi:MAG: hypothetical protein AAB442_00410 [Patescibacteria group bacterium]
MDPEIARQLEEIREVTHENNRMLRSIHRDLFIDMFGKYILWALFILGSVYWIVSYLAPLGKDYSMTTGQSPSGPFGLPSSADIQKLINSYKAGQ